MRQPAMPIGNKADAGTGPVDAFPPVVMFSVLFGLSMDYEVYTVSRMQEDGGGCARAQRTRPVSWTWPVPVPAGAEPLIHAGAFPDGEAVRDSTLSSQAASMLAVKSRMAFTSSPGASMAA